MKPIKSAIPLAKWLLRIAVLLIVYDRFFREFKTFSFNNLNYFIAFIMVITSIFLLFGGFLSKTKVTTVSGLVLVILSIILIFLQGFGINGIVNNISVLSIGFYFLARGNKG